MLTVTVTQEHIDKAVRCEPDNCPIYHAISPYIVDGVDFHVLHSKATTTVIGTWTIVKNRLQGRHLHPIYTHPFPNRVRDIITKYDHGGEMKPFEFEFDIPKDYIK